MDKKLFDLEKSCVRCELRPHCTQVVPGRGPHPAQIMIVGEAPGADEDKIGQPFVGASGKLLDRMLFSAEIERSSIFVSNTLKCRPPNNRKPTQDEIDICKNWLKQEINIVNPLVIIPMGATAAKLLLRGRSSFSITKSAGTPVKMDYLKENGIVVPMLHPSYLLHNNMHLLEEMVKVFIKVKRYVAQYGDEGAIHKVC